MWKDGVDDRGNIQTGGGEKGDEGLRPECENP